MGILLPLSWIVLGIISTFYLYVFVDHTKTNITIGNICICVLCGCLTGWVAFLFAIVYFWVAFLFAIVHFVDNLLVLSKIWNTVVYKKKKLTL